MVTQGATTIEQTDQEIILSRIYDAPRELVFSMFKEPEYVSQWWGPTTWPVTICTIDFQPGGTWHYCMSGPDGQEAWGKAVYQAIDEPNSIVFRDSFSDAMGNVNKELPQTTVTVTFEGGDDITKLMFYSVYDSSEDRQKIVDMGALEGVKDTWNQLDRLLARLQTV